MNKTRDMKAWLRLQWYDTEHDNKGITPLHIAARYGLIEYARSLIENQADVHARDVDGETPLWWAAGGGHGALIRMLVAAGADPDVDDKLNGLKPLHKAASKNRADAVRALLEAGVNPLTEKTKESPGRRCGNAPRTRGHTPLMVCTL
jgi:ankyrin repeat protein